MSRSKGGTDQLKAGIVDAGRTRIRDKGDITLLEGIQHTVKLAKFIMFVVTGLGRGDVEGGLRLKIVHQRDTEAQRKP